MKTTNKKEINHCFDLTDYMLGDHSTRARFAMDKRTNFPMQMMFEIDVLKLRHCIDMCRNQLDKGFY